MHLGGIGTGNFEIGADGQLTTWQLFNTLRDGQIPFHFAVKAGSVAKLLQTAGGPEWPRVEQIEMKGEYPVANLRFEDKDIPLRIELDAFSPFAPLDTGMSSLPLAIFRFRIHNPTKQSQEISLAAMLANPVGYAAIGKIKDGAHPSLGSNVNETFHDGRASGLFLTAQSGKEPALDKSVAIFVLKDVFRIAPDPEAGNKNDAYVPPEVLAIPPLDRPKNLELKVIDGEFSTARLPDPRQTVIWLEDAPVDLPQSLLAEIKKAVEGGATLVFSGSLVPLLAAYAAITGGKPVHESAQRPDIIYEDFEGGYDRWSVEGEAFGSSPAHGGFSNQQRISGVAGHGFVNSYVNGDGATGKLTSRDFVVERKFIRFLVGGGRYSKTQIRLIIGGEVVRAASGRDSEQMKPVSWSVAEFAGRTAHIEIVDEQQGGWGHILVDQIVFTDWPGESGVPPLLEELLPIRFSGVQAVAGEPEEPRRIAFQDRALYPGAETARAKNGFEQFTKPVGQGRVMVWAGQLLDPARNYSARERQNAYSILCSAVGGRYESTVGQSATEPGFGTLSLVALAGEVTALARFENWEEAWKQFQKSGRFDKFESSISTSATAPGQTTNCALAATVSLAPGEKVEVPFLFAWHYPNKYAQNGEWMGCHYATKWTNARAVVRHAAADYQALCKKTEQFRETFYDSTLPYWMLDGITANSATIRHIGVVFRIANGDVYGWEGSNGSCEPTCTHVWGYEQSLAHLFPDLEKEMRRIDFTHQQNPDGGINNRTDVPSPAHPTNERPFTDGQASCILKAYREALNSKDDSFFKQYWPHVKRAVEYLIARDAKTSGGQASGVLKDDQWNTYDEALHGVTTFISGYYLAALRAGEEWARRMGDTTTADVYRGIFQTGRQKLIELCWNGEYFQQYFPEYQKARGEVGPGCMADQLIGQWWAHQLGLGYILPQEMVVSSLKSIFKYNWKADLTHWKHQPRAFAGAQDKGLIVCTWPKGGRPENVMLYSDEVWTGIEYQVAAHMFYEGMLEEGFSIVKGARDRYDGVPRPPIGRNPWCEIECGGHYTRAMSSWSLLLALSGYYYDGPRRVLRFAPRHQTDDFRCFFSAPEGWGSVAQKSRGQLQTTEISVKSGQVRIKTLELATNGGDRSSNVTVNYAGRQVLVTSSTDDGICRISFKADGITVKAEEKLEVICKK